MKRLICTIPFLLFLSTGLIAQKDVYNASNTVFIELVGNDTSFEYTSNDLISRLSKKNTRIEFSLLLNTVKPVIPVDSSKAREVFELVFSPNQGLLLRLTATIPKSTFNLKELQEAKSYVLDGVLSLFNENVRVPVEMSMYYREGAVFFNLNFNFDLALWEMQIPQEILSVFTGEIKVYVKNGVWNSLIFDNVK